MTGKIVQAMTVKELIEKWANTGCDLSGPSVVRGAVAGAIREALELAAQEVEREGEQRKTEYDLVTPDSMAWCVAKRIRALQEEIQ